VTVSRANACCGFCLELTAAPRRCLQSDFERRQARSEELKRVAAAPDRGAAAAASAVPEATALYSREAADLRLPEGQSIRVELRRPVEGGGGESGGGFLARLGAAPASGRAAVLVPPPGAAAPAPPPAPSADPFGDDAFASFAAAPEPGAAPAAPPLPGGAAPAAPPGWAAFS
jgi:hypothetical protein